MWEIGKQFEFDYGHRVWNQSLNKEYSLDDACTCKHIHGHRGTVIVYLKDSKLVDGMVTDFKHLNWFKKFLDDTLDHKFILDIHDPLLKYELPILFEERITPDFFKLSSDREYKYHIIHSHVYNDLEPCLREKYSGIVLVDFVPTSENISKWLLEIIQYKMKPLNIEVSRVQFFETPKSQSNYYA